MFTNDITTITNNIGKLTELTTTVKNTLVNAINEVNAKPSGETTPISNATNITTSGTYALDAVQNNADVANTLRNLIVKLQDLYNTLSGNITNLTSKVNTNTNNIGSLTSLTTTNKDTLVDAINNVNVSFFDGTSQSGMCIRNSSRVYIDTLFNSPIWNKDITLNQPAILIVDILNSADTGNSYYNFGYKADGQYYPYVYDPVNNGFYSYTDITINLGKNRHDTFYIPKNVTFKIWSNDFSDKEEVADGSYFQRMLVQLLYLNTDGLG